MDRVYKFLRDKLSITRRQMRIYYDCNWSKISKWKPDDKILLDDRFIKNKLPSKKLYTKMYGPFQLIKRVWKNTPKLKSSDTLRSHDVLNVSLMDSYPRCMRFPRPENYCSLGALNPNNIATIRANINLSWYSLPPKKIKKNVNYSVKWVRHPIDAAIREP